MEKITQKDSLYSYSFPTFISLVRFRSTKWTRHQTIRNEARIAHILVREINERDIWDTWRKMEDNIKIYVK
jgi:hypothetical protein